MERKSERVTFIAPNSFVSNARYILLKDKIIFGDKAIIKSFITPKDSIVIYKKKYNELNSPLKFNLFLTFSTKENFENEFYLTNKFYLSEILELKDKEYYKADFDRDASYFYFYYSEDENLSNSGYHW